MNVFAAARPFLSVRDIIWSFGIMAQVVRHGGDQSTIFVRKTTQEEKDACVSARNVTAKK